MENALNKRIRSIVEHEGAIVDRSGLAQVLEWLSWAYGIGVRVRNTAYGSGALPVKRLPCKVISIGNLTAGGTGKTPMTLYVAQRIMKMGHSVAVVSRGYRGGFENRGGIVSDGMQMLCSPRESGDEPFMLAKILKAPVVVGKSRYRSGMAAVKSFSPDVIVLDDGFQHRGVTRDLDLILMDTNAPIGNGYLLPRGRLREPLSSLFRSHALVFTRSDRVTGDRCVEKAIAKACRCRLPVFYSTHVPVVSQWSCSQGTVVRVPGQTDLSNAFKNKTGLLVSAIADNIGFRRTCELMGLKVKGHIEFPDHYWYKDIDIDEISARLARSSADILVTTEKDYAKFMSRLSGSATLVVVGVRIGFDTSGTRAFDRLIEQTINR